MDILITEDLDSPAIRALDERYEVVRGPTLWKEAERLAAELCKARAVMIRNQTKLTAGILASAPNLRAIGRVGVGLDNIDLGAATRRGIVVIAPLEANAVSVAELTLGLILALARKIPGADRSTKAGQWDRRGCTGTEVQGKTLAICGFGRIGKAVATRAQAFGMEVVIYDPFIEPDVSLESILLKADFVSAHLPLTPQTKHLFNAQTLAQMKRGSCVINTSRGGVVEESALLQGLLSGHLAGAALDVREIEPPNQPDAFAKLDNVILTPHVGAFTHEAQARTFEAVCSDLDRILRGEPAVNFVNFASPGSNA